jgi:eukaryotic-like serine/threonine-protein kinase
MLIRMDGQSSTTRPPIPQSLYGYDVIGRIGEGAGSTIYAVSEPKSSQVYALKHVIVRTERDLRYIQQLETEMQVSRKFRHPGLRRYHDLKISKTLLRKISEAALVMELVDGTPLQEQPVRQLAEVMAIFRQVAEALGALHYLLHVHCDIKPSNIITDSEGQVKLIDFGQTVKINTIKERIQGTPDFIAPEQLKLKPVTVQTDVYSFGATMYWALSGKRMPTLFTVSRENREMVLESRFPSPRDLDDRVPQTLSDLVMDCVKVSPSRRPPDMKAVLARLNGRH